MRTEEGTGGATREPADAVGIAADSVARAVGAFSICARVCECSAIACPSLCMRRRIGAVSSVMCFGIRKNVAATPSRRSTSSSAGVAAGFGPSSYVR